MSRLSMFGPLKLFWRSPSGRKYRCNWCRRRFEDQDELSKHIQATEPQLLDTEQICNPADRCDWCGARLQEPSEHVSATRANNEFGRVCIPHQLGSSSQLDSATLIGASYAPKDDISKSAPSLGKQGQSLISSPMTEDSIQDSANRSKTNLSEKSYATAHSSSMASYCTAQYRSDRKSWNPVLNVDLDADVRAVDDFVQGVMIKSSKYLGRTPDTATHALLRSRVLRFLKKDLTIEVTKISSVVSMINDLVVQLCDIISSEPGTTSGKIKMRSAVARDAFDFFVQVGHLDYLVTHLEDAYKKNFYVVPLGPKQVFSSQWIEHLRASGILLDPADELDWSGYGQHVEFDPKDEIPLQTEEVLGYSATAIVESVRCRRIRLARKKIRCSRQVTKEMVVTEVKHLQDLQHSHIVRVIGTYTQKKDLAILLYPATPWNLEDFMDEILDESSSINEDATITENWSMRTSARALRTFFGCLANALSAIHDSNVKHMDIKPKNMLVRPFGSAEQPFKVYVADFGIARGYASAAESETDSPIPFTRAYAAPEVILQDTRGFRADIFSLGCVYLEMLATIVSTPNHNARHALTNLRTTSSGDSSFQANIEAIQSWYQEMFLASSQQLRRDFELGDRLLDVIPEMIRSSPTDRPSAGDLERWLRWFCCKSCNEGPEPFEAAESVSK